jgi:uncharacterized protein YkwD
MRRVLFTLIAICLIPVTADACCHRKARHHGGGCCGHKSKHQTVYTGCYQEPCGYAPTCTTTSCPAPQYVYATPQAVQLPAPPPPAKSTPQAPPKATPQERPALPPPPPPTTYVDPLAPINAIRARHGLPPLRWDGNLAAHAATNNAHQARRGMGHHVTGGAMQCVAMTGSSHSAAQMWYASAPHRNIMLSRTATVAGLAAAGRYATLNVR